MRRRKQSESETMTCFGIVITFFAFMFFITIKNLPTNGQNRQSTHSSRVISKPVNDIEKNAVLPILKLESDSIISSDFNADLKLEQGFRIVGDGWPSTPVMWPGNKVSNYSADDSKVSLEASTTSVKLPFIYVDKNDTSDYSLFLNLNLTLLDILKNQLKPMKASLSFDYFFKFASNVTAKPAIRIEIDRKAVRMLEAKFDSNKTALPMWFSFVDLVTINDLSKPDWLKISMINREYPSTVAIRRLRIEFKMDSNETTNKVMDDIQPGDNSPELQPGGGGGGGDFENTNQPYSQPQDDNPSALTDDIVPFDKKNQVDGHRITKRQVQQDLKKNIVLNCMNPNECDFKPQEGRQLQWSLASMPPSNDKVASGFFYVSNQRGYGDADKLLQLSLEQTENATIIDFEADQCIELSIFVTQETYLHVYRMTKANQINSKQSKWIRGPLLLSYPSTIIAPSRSNTTFLQDLTLDYADKQQKQAANLRLSSKKEYDDDWLYETYCFSDFFVSNSQVKSLPNCKAGECAFGFMLSTQSAYDQQDLKQDLNLNIGPLYRERLAAIGLLRRFATRSTRQMTNSRKYLKAWQAEATKPNEYWRFFPSEDWRMYASNASLVNLRDKSEYYALSDWIEFDSPMEFNATFMVETSAFNKADFSAAFIASLPPPEQKLMILASDTPRVMNIKASVKVLDAKLGLLYKREIPTLELSFQSNETKTYLDLSVPITDKINRNQVQRVNSAISPPLFKLQIKITLECHWLVESLPARRFITDKHINYKMSLVNVSLADRCNPSPCNQGTCLQNGIKLDDWQCECDDQHRGRKCEFGRWCKIAHVSPWTTSRRKLLSSTNSDSNSGEEKSTNEDNIVVDNSIASLELVSGDDFCHKKLGIGSNCTELDVKLSDLKYNDEGVTFVCNCMGDYYLSDSLECRQAHLCDSIICRSPGSSCDSSKPFDATQPCQCNSTMDWQQQQQQADNSSSAFSVGECQRTQCSDIERDCGFRANICLPNVFGERPICKCGSKFVEKISQIVPPIGGSTNEDPFLPQTTCKTCESTACNLPNLNDCAHICTPNSTNPIRPYDCSCFDGYTLAKDNSSCDANPNKHLLAQNCQSLCDEEQQVCTDSGCKCRQGFKEISFEFVTIEEEVVGPDGQLSHSTNTQFRTVKCQNICELTFDIRVFNQVKSVCPFGCNSNNFTCKCDAPNSAYESESEDGKTPLCRRKRVCAKDGKAYDDCKNRNAICAPSFSFPFYECVCPKLTTPFFYGPGSGDFTCEPLCNDMKSQCLRQEAVCRLTDTNSVSCTCEPGMMFDEKEQRCYMAKYTYSFSLIVANKYYQQQQIDFIHSSKEKNHTLTDPLQHDNNNISQPWRLIAEMNQCNLSQVLPQFVLDDPYEQSTDSYLEYIEKCNLDLQKGLRMARLNSQLADDVRKALRQDLRDFTVTTSDEFCTELVSQNNQRDFLSSIQTLNCTIYVQSNEALSRQTIDNVLSNCDPRGADRSLCWIKPSLLLSMDTSLVPTTKVPSSGQSSIKKRELVSDFKQVIPCELRSFCDKDAVSVRLDNKTSRCSCKCFLTRAKSIRELERSASHQLMGLNRSSLAVREICLPRNHCLQNSTFCSSKQNSECKYDTEIGSICVCKHNYYMHNANGSCLSLNDAILSSTTLQTTLAPILIEATSSSVLYSVIVFLSIALIISVAVNLFIALRSSSLLGRSQDYPLSKYHSADQQHHQHQFQDDSCNRLRPHINHNRSTGIPNEAFIE